MTRDRSSWLLLVLILGVMLAMTRVNFDLRAGEYRPWKPTAESGDEPHYQIVINSLLFDHDLELADDYRRARHGESNAGRLFARRWLDHHTILFDPETGSNHLWWDAFDWMKPVRCRRDAFDCFRPNPELNYRRTPATREVSAHPAAFPALLAVLVGASADDPEQSEVQVGYALIVLAWLALLVMLPLCRRAGLDEFQSAVAVSLVGLASPWLVYSGTRFAETTLGLSVLLALWALQCGRPVLAGLAAGAAAAMKPPFALFGVLWVLELAWRRQWRDAIRLGATLALIGLPLMWFNLHQAGRILVSGNQGWLPRESALDVFETLIDGQGGLLVVVPWTLFAVVSIWRALGRNHEDPGGLHAQLMLPLAASMLVFGAFGSQGGAYGPRYWVPCLPLLAILAVDGASRLGRLGQLVLGASALLGGALAISAALLHMDAWHVDPFEPLRVLLKG